MRFQIRPTRFGSLLLKMLGTNGQWKSFAISTTSLGLPFE